MKKFFISLLVGIMVACCGCGCTCSNRNTAEEIALETAVESIEVVDSVATDVLDVADSTLTITETVEKTEE